MRSRTDQVHVATNDIDQLQQLIESEPAQPFPDLCDPVEIVLCPLGRGLIDRLPRSKLDQLEGSHSFSDPGLTEQHRAAGLQLDGQRNQREEWSKDHDAYQGRHKTKYSLSGFEAPPFPEFLGGGEL